MLFFYLYLKTKRKLDIFEKQKILKISVYYANFLTEGIFKTYKNQLKTEVNSVFYHNKEKKNKIKNIKSILLKFKTLKNFNNSIISLIIK